MSFQQGLSGLNGAQKSLDAISNNVANAATAGFKLSQAQFADVFAASLQGAAGNQIGIGSRVDSVLQQFTQGNLSITNNPLDVAINGQGFFRMDNNGAISYSRNGQFSIDKSGFIVNGSNASLSGFQADTNGNIIPSSPGPIQISAADLNPNPTSLSEVVVNLDSRQGQPANVAAWTAPFLASGAVPLPDMYNASTSLTTFDTLGNQHVMTMYFVKAATAGNWDVYTSLDTPSVTNRVRLASAASPTLHFTTDGLLDTGTTPMPLAQSFPVTTGAATPLAYTLDFTGSTQFGSTFGVNSLLQDGFSSGRLAGLSIAGDGIVQGRYSNGQSRNLGQVVLVNFANPNGLLSLGGNQWSETSASGAPLIGAPSSGSLGVLQAAAVEESNVDLTQELVAMITQQRNYQANAQSIKTQDQILQTLVNLR